MSTLTALRRIHPAAGLVATATILVFWTSTTGALLFASPEAMVTVKHAIAWGLILLIPALATTGATGSILGRGSQNPKVRAKQRRMTVIAATGLLVLVPCVLYLAATITTVRSESTAFWTVQTIELLAGATNITLMSLNIRDGLQLTRRLAGGKQPR